MRRIFHNEKLPKISKSILVKENLLKDSFYNRSSSYSCGDIQHHRLFRKRIVRLKEQKMKYIIDRNKSKFFNQESSISELSSIRSNKDEKIPTFFDVPKMNKKNDTDNIFISAFIGIKYVGILSNYTLIFTKLICNACKYYIFNAIRRINIF